MSNDLHLAPPCLTGQQYSCVNQLVTAAVARAVSSTGETRRLQPRFEGLGTVFGVLADCPRESCTQVGITLISS